MPISIVAQAGLVAVWAATLPFWFYSAEWGVYPAAATAGLVIVTILLVPGKPERPSDRSRKFSSAGGTAGKGEIE